jgi:hypothetical protein
MGEGETDPAFYRWFIAGLLCVLWEDGAGSRWWISQLDFLVREGLKVKWGRGAPLPYRGNGGAAAPGPEENVGRRRNQAAPELPETDISMLL